MHSLLCLAHTPYGADWLLCAQTGKKEYQLSLAREEDDAYTQESWTVETPVEVLREGWEGWDPRYATFIALKPVGKSDT